jgi:hypothetical protein
VEGTVRNKASAKAEPEQTAKRVADNRSFLIVVVVMVVIVTMVSIAMAVPSLWRSF